MFGFFKKKQADSLDRPVGKGDPIISALLLEGTSFPVDDFLKQAAKTRIAGKSISNINPGDGNVFSFDVADDFVALAIMPAPYPDLAGPIATTWMWPEKPSIENVKKHRSHLLITVTGGSGDPVRRRLVLTAVTSLAAKQPGVTAVYWPEASLVLFPPIFTSMADDLTSPEAPPLYLWVDLRAFRNGDGTTGMFTVGLAPLGLMEIEIPRIEMPVCRDADARVDVGSGLVCRRGTGSDDADRRLPDRPIATTGAAACRAVRPVAGLGRECPWVGAGIGDLHGDAVHHFERPVLAVWAEDDWHPSHPAVTNDFAFFLKSPSTGSSTTAPDYWLETAL